MPARLLPSAALLEQLDAGVIDQITNVATLPGMAEAVYRVPDRELAVAPFDSAEGRDYRS